MVMPLSIVKAQFCRALTITALFGILSFFWDVMTVIVLVATADDADGKSWPFQRGVSAAAFILATLGAIVWSVAQFASPWPVRYSVTNFTSGVLRGVASPASTPGFASKEAGGGFGGGAGELRTPLINSEGITVSGQRFPEHIRAAFRPAITVCYFGMAVSIGLYVGAFGAAASLLTLNSRTANNVLLAVSFIFRTLIVFFNTNAWTLFIRATANASEQRSTRLASAVNAVTHIINIAAVIAIVYLLTLVTERNAFSPYELEKKGKIVVMLALAAFWYLVTQLNPLLCVIKGASLM